MRDGKNNNQDVRLFIEIEERERESRRLGTCKERAND